MPPKATRPRLLVVDNDSGLEEMVRLLFELEGWEASRLSGEDPMSILRRSEADNDIVVFDFNFEPSVGREVLDQLLQLPDSARRRMVLLADGTAEELGSLEESVEVLRKPFQIHELVEAARRRLDARPRG